MTRDNITLEALAKEATPYDQSVCGQGKLLELVKKYPNLGEQFQQVVTEKFLTRIEEVGKCYFIINNKSYKARKNLPKSVRISYCGQSKDPVISVDI